MHAQCSEIFVDHTRAHADGLPLLRNFVAFRCFVRFGLVFQVSMVASRKVDFQKFIFFLFYRSWSAVLITWARSARRILFVLRLRWVSHRSTNWPRRTIWKKRICCTEHQKPKNLLVFAESPLANRCWLRDRSMNICGRTDSLGHNKYNMLIFPFWTSCKH